MVSTRATQTAPKPNPAMLDPERMGFVLVAVLSLAAAAAVLTAPILPFQDLPAHGAILRLLADPDKYATWFIPASPYVHSWLAYLLAGVLAGPLGLDGAIRFLVALSVAGLPLAAWGLGRQLTGQGAAAGLAGVVGAFNLSVGMGFLPWNLACLAAMSGTAGIAWAMATPSRTLIAVALAAAFSLLSYGLHFFGYLLFAGLAGSFVVIAVRGRVLERVVVGLAAIGPGALAFMARHAAGGGGISGAGVDLPAIDIVAQLGLLAEALTLGSRPVFDDIVAWTAIAVVWGGIVAALFEQRGLTRSRRWAWALLAAFTLFVLIIIVPSHMTKPRIVLAGPRMVPVALVLAAMVGPRRGWPAVVIRWVLAATAVLAIGFATAAIHLDGATLLPQARMFDQLVPGRVLASVAAHRPPHQALLTNHAGIHLPERYLATGRGVTLFPFLHSESPVALRLPYSTDVEELYRDLPTFLKRAASWADLVAGELGSDERASVAMTNAGFLPCERQGQGDWRFWTRRAEPCFVAKGSGADVEP